MATNGINPTAQVLNVNFACVTLDSNMGYPNIYPLTQFTDKIIRVCGGIEKALKTAVLVCPVSTPGTGVPSKFQYAETSVLLVPKTTISNNDMSYLWKNKTIERFYNGEGDATNSAGTSCVFTFDKIPEFQFTGIHLHDNPMSFDIPPDRDITTYPPPASRIGIGIDAPWATFVVSGYDLTTPTPPAVYPYTLQIDANWLNDFFTKYADKGIISNCKMTFTPNVNGVQTGSSSGGPTTLGALSDVTLGPLPVLHTTTRLSYVPTSSKWENVPVLQLHEWQYKLGYVTPPAEGTFKLNSNTLAIATELAIHKISQAKYQDDNWLVNAIDPSRKNLIQIQFNTYTYIYRVNGTTTDNGTWRAYPIEYVDGWGNAILPDDIVAFSIIDDTPVYDATNIGSGLGVFEQKTGQTLEFKCIDTGVGLAASTSVGNEITIQLSAVLDDLGDVDLTVPPVLNQVLQYNGADWVAATISTGSLNNFTAVVDPTVTDDSSLGYTVGSQWLNTATDQLWFCADASIGVAVWRISTTEYEATSVRTNTTATIGAGVSNAVAIGNNATIISGNQSIVIGVDAGVDGANSVGIGRLVDIQAGSCTAVGSYSVCTTTHGTALGHQASSGGNGHIALGAGATTTATEKLALGFNGNNNVAVGTQFARLPVSIDGTARNLLMRDTDIALDGLTDVQYGDTLATGAMLYYDGTKWTNKLPRWSMPKFVETATTLNGVTNIQTFTYFGGFRYDGSTQSFANVGALFSGTGPVHTLRYAIYNNNGGNVVGSTLKAQSTTLTAFTNGIISRPLTAEVGQDLIFRHGNTYYFVICLVGAGTGSPRICQQGTAYNLHNSFYNSVNYIAGFPATLGVASTAITQYANSVVLTT